MVRIHLKLGVKLYIRVYEKAKYKIYKINLGHL
jgi:hypothetical protein